MRRVSGPPQGTNFYLKRDLHHKIKSPNPKSKIKQYPDTSNSQTLPIRKAHSFHQKNDQSITHTKPSKKVKSKNKSVNKLKKYEKQIMEVLNNAATLIQRQWRKYMVRKYRKSMSQLQMLNSLTKSPNFKKEEQYITRINNFEQKSVSNCTYENYSSYNQNKYANKVPSYDMNQVFNFNISGSKVVRTSVISEKQSLSQFSDGHRITQEMALSRQKKIIQKNTPTLVKSANYIANHHRTTSERVQLRKISQESNDKNKSHKKLGLNTNAIALTIQPPKYSIAEQLLQTPVKPQSPMKRGYDDCYFPDKQIAIDQVLSKVEQSLQKKKLKKMLDLQNSFQNNMVTFRSYQKNKSKISQEHTQILELKKRKLYDKWRQIIEISKVEQPYTMAQNPQINKQEIQSNKKIENKYIQKKSESNILQDPQSLSEITDNLDIDLGLNFDSNRKQIHFDDWQLSSDRKINQMHKQNLAEQAQIKKIKSKFQRYSQDAVQLQPLPLEISEDQAHEIEKIAIKKEAFKVKNTQKNSQVENNIVQPAQIQQPSNICQQIIRIQEGQQDQSVKNQKDQVNKNQQHQIQQKYSEKTQKTPRPINIHHNVYAIRPSIDYVNSWLLDVSHFILDNYLNQLGLKLINVQQPNSLQLYQKCVDHQGILPTMQYKVITDKQFQTFQYYHIKSWIEDGKIEGQMRDSFAALTYCFHQALFDSLNRMLQDELIQGRNWIYYPWLNQFKVRKIIIQQHGKQCLQKAINRVSSIADYTIFPISEVSNRNFQAQLSQYILVLLQQIFEQSYESNSTKTALLHQLSISISETLINEQCTTLKQIISTSYNQ